VSERSCQNKVERPLGVKLGPRTGTELGPFTP
jgi:hypothetical protein